MNIATTIYLWWKGKYRPEILSNIGTINTYISPKKREKNSSDILSNKSNVLDVEEDWGKKKKEKKRLRHTKTCISIHGTVTT